MEEIPVLEKEVENITRTNHAYFTIEELEEIKEYIFQQLPRVLEQDPRFVTFVEGIVADKFPKRDELARMLDKMDEFQREQQEGFRRVDQQFEQVDQRFEQVDRRFERVDQRFEQVDRRFEQVDQRLGQVDQRLGQVDQRLGQVDQRFEQVDQRITSLETEMKNGFRDVQISIDRLGARWGIRNESVFRQIIRELLEKSYGDTVEEREIGGEQFDCIISNGQHILVEITASAKKNILERLQRKRQLYIAEMGVTPARFILAVGSIHSRRAAELRAAGFEVIEPEED